jgi:polysaccharide deacetylase 2 family uncharacterized protein YibQ
MIRPWLLLFLLVCTGVFSGASQADQRPVLSLVIDDLGYSLENGKAAIGLDGDHTYAILPGAVYSQKLARYAHQLNKEVILHLPMQSIRSSAAHEPGALNEAMDEDELTGNVHSLLEQIPFIRGVNNHMGSHLTEFDFFMRPVMDSIRSYNPSFYFLDSRTSPRSVAYTQARDAGLSTISRDIFLDNDPSTTAIELQYNIWLTRARARGSAIAIGHPYSHTLKVLQHSLPEAGENFTFMRISELIEARSKNESSTQWGSQLTTPETAAE